MVTNSQDQQTDTHIFCVIHRVEVEKAEEWGDGC